MLVCERKDPGVVSSNRTDEQGRMIAEHFEAAEPEPNATGPEPPIEPEVTEP